LALPSCFIVVRGFLSRCGEFDAYFDLGLPSPEDISPSFKLRLRLLPVVSFFKLLTLFYLKGESITN